MSTPAPGIFELIWNSNAFWTVVGFVVGAFSSVVIERWSRFRNTMDRVCKIFVDFDGTMRSCGSSHEIGLLSDTLFREIDFELLIQGQFVARDKVVRLRSDLLDVFNHALTQTNATPPSWIRKRQVVGRFDQRTHDN